MALTPSTMLALGTIAPNAALPDTVSNTNINIHDLLGPKGLVVMFLCNHCPYVIHVNPEIVHLSKDYIPKGIGFVGISSNDVVNYPQDGPDFMKKHAQEVGYRFPYLYDESQEVAKAYDAACTPDFYVFNKNLKLVYRGRLDDSKPGNDIALTGKDIRSALDSIIDDDVPNSEQFPSMGCNIKWKK